MATFAPCSERPVFNAITGFFNARALAAARAKAGISVRPSMWRPMAVMRSSSASASSISAMPTSAWLPMAKAAAIGRARRVMVKLQAMLPDCVTTATPRSHGSMPCSSGHRAARARPLTKP